MSQRGSAAPGVGGVWPAQGLGVPHGGRGGQGGATGPRRGPGRGPRGRGFSPSVRGRAPCQRWLSVRGYSVSPRSGGRGGVPRVPRALGVALPPTPTVRFRVAHALPWKRTGRASSVGLRCPQPAPHAAASGTVRAGTQCPFCLPGPAAWGWVPWTKGLLLPRSPGAHLYLTGTKPPAVARRRGSPPFPSPPFPSSLLLSPLLSFPFSSLSLSSPQIQHISSLASPTLPKGGQLAAPAPSSLRQSLQACGASGPFPPGFLTCIPQALFSSESSLGPSHLKLPCPTSLQRPVSRPCWGLFSPQLPPQLCLPAPC